MANLSSIEWTEATWNPVTGCQKVSPGCKNCYALRMSSRLQAMGSKNYQNGFSLELHEHMLELPLKWKKPRTIFVNSMSDLFHQGVPDTYIQKVFGVMAKASHHTFQVLTKRAERLPEIAAKLEWAPNIWMGVSVENQKYTSRIAYLQQVPAAIRFLSVEPLIGAIEQLPLKDIHWVIVGGESGPKSRPMEAEWVDCIQHQCQEAAVPFFFKQWGGTNKKKAGRLFKEQTWDAMPITPSVETQTS